MIERILKPTQERGKYMILADKILDLRKKSGLSQEELAYKLGVSRQAVSKWESAQAIPDLNRIIKLAEVFSISTDYLLKDNYEPSDIEPMSDKEMNYMISLDDAMNYLSLKETSAHKVALGVLLCIVSPTLLMILWGLSQQIPPVVSEMTAVILGVFGVLIMVAIGVANFIQADQMMEDVEYIEEEVIETQYGVDSIVTEKYAQFKPKANKALVMGIILYITSPLMIIWSALTEREALILYSVVLLLGMVAFATYLITQLETIKEGYQALLQKDKYSISYKQAHKKTSPFLENVYWPIVLVLYLGISFVTGRWEITWLIWPLAGILESIVTYFMGKD